MARLHSNVGEIRSSGALRVQARIRVCLQRPPPRPVRNISDLPVPARVSAHGGQQRRGRRRAPCQPHLRPYSIAPHAHSRRHPWPTQHERPQATLMDAAAQCVERPFAAVPAFPHASMATQPGLNRPSGTILRQTAQMCLRGPWSSLARSFVHISFYSSAPKHARTFREQRAAREKVPRPSSTKIELKSNEKPKIHHIP